MPGTDLCIKVGGWVRAEAAADNNGNMTWGPFNANAQQRSTNNLTFRARGYITADVRNQTEYGTVRGYLAVGLNTNDTGLQVTSLVDSANRAFVQWAGMTAGLSQSFYDFYSAPAMQYRGGYLPASDTGDSGWFVWAYTAQFGGGFSGTISAEARRVSQIIDANCVATGAAAAGHSDVAVVGAVVVREHRGREWSPDKTDPYVVESSILRQELHSQVTQLLSEVLVNELRDVRGGDVEIVGLSRHLPRERLPKRTTYRSSAAGSCRAAASARAVAVPCPLGTRTTVKGGPSGDRGGFFRHAVLDSTPRCLSSSIRMRKRHSRATSLEGPRISSLTIGDEDRGQRIRRCQGCAR